MGPQDDAVEAARDALRMLAVGDHPVCGSRELRPGEVADLLDALALALGHLGRAAAFAARTPPGPRRPDDRPPSAD
ncbi:hypothetical protein [Actinomycetospora lemnae]|uniref:Uncharacterized protein n=1 Tax=Actinomycetospora lemnae TaxID=3019891 RepID=A0ABT5STV9_9PSEU|nr:hypothetical protein [Actinomycetospora sp. DW7H6]MDD7966204.1 hypothetical protein [Actinomycetospora sp. DW7H6]